MKCVGGVVRLTVSAVRGVGVLVYGAVREG